MNGPWADGTPCKDSDYYWCLKGECVPRDNRGLKPIQGGWGAWSSYSHCSRTCGGGIQESHRECNNPVPQNGGKYCMGSKRRYLSCNTNECPAHLPNLREQQCQERNGDHYNIPGVTKDVRWIPKYGGKFSISSELVNLIREFFHNILQSINAMNVNCIAGSKVMMHIFNYQKRSSMVQDVHMKVLINV